MQLAQVSLAAQHPLLETWRPRAERLPLLAREHEGNLELATSLEFAAMRHERFSVPGAEVTDYLNRWVPVSADLTALLSIRFRGGDRGVPFVDVSGVSRPWTPADLAAAANAARKVYGLFAPLYLQLQSSAPVGAFHGLGRDRRFLAAPLAELATRAVTSPAELSLRPTTDARHLAQAVAAYAALDAQHPGHTRQATILSREDLNECVAAGLMYDVLVGKAWAGYAGVLPGEKLGLPVYTVQELLLTPEFRGRGYGAHLTTLLARALLAGPEPTRLLFGTVHADNAGAYPAALRAGRHDVGGWVELPLT
jgi:GNAT superfamily N-acetyltransferase